jgi:hypothetical protein
MDIIKLFPDGFPLTIERLEFVQNAYKKAITELAGGITGKGVILEGVVNTAGVLSNGVIVTPAGEIIAFEGGAIDARVAIFETVTQVPYNIDANSDGNLDLKDSDVVRVAKCASTGGVDAFNFSELKRVPNLKNLFPVGIILPYEGLPTDVLPAGWEFYDLADTFIMGAGGTNAVGTNGGANSKTILQANLPNYSITGNTASAGAHTHPYKDSYYIEHFTGGINGNDYVGQRIGSGDTDGDNLYIWYRNGNTSSSGAHTHSFNFNLNGGGVALDVRPKFKALLFIKYVGF